MAEVISIAAATENEALAQYQFAKSARPNMNARVLRRDTFEKGRFNIVPGIDISGFEGAAESVDGNSIYLVIAEFS